MEGFLSDAIGAYELSVSRLIDDHGDDTTTATSLAFPASVLGSIEIAGDTDWFSFTASAGQKFEFAVPVHDQYSDLTLYDTDGTTQLEQDTFDAPTFIWSAPSDGTYYLSVESLFSNDVGDYELTAAIADDDHSDISASATPFSVSSGATGSIEVESDHDWFTFDAIAGLAYDFTLEWTGPESGELSLIDTDGTTVLVNDSFAPSFTWDALESGTYFLVVEGSFRTYLGDYELLASTTLQETTIAFDRDAYLTPSDVTVELLDATGFSPGATLTIESSSGDSETLTITSTGIEFSTTLGTTEALANPNDGTLQISSGDRLVATYLDTDQGLGGKFFLETASIFVDDHGNNHESATFVDFPSTPSGVIEINGDEDWFGFHAVAGLEYVFETQLDSLARSTLVLYDTDGTTQILSDTSSIGSEISWQAPETGEYYLAARSANSFSSGSYQLNASISATLFIEDVIVSGSQFTSEFIDVAGGENGLGYSLLGDHQLEALPWMNIDTFYLQFSEDVSASLSADDVVLTGTHGGTYDLELAGYDTASNTAEFRINGDINTESFVISIFDGSITNSLGLALDGDWTTGQTDQSGDGTQGGQFDFYFNVLVGDEDNSGQVNSVDAFSIFASSTEATNQTNFRRDIDGSGQINSTDAFAAFANTTSGLLAAPTPPVAFDSSTSLLTALAGDDLFSEEAPLTDIKEEPTNSTELSTDLADNHGSDFETAPAVSIPVVLSGTFELSAYEDKLELTVINSAETKVDETDAPAVLSHSTSDRDAFFSEEVLLADAVEAAASFGFEPLELAAAQTYPVAFTSNQTALEDQDDRKKLAQADGLLATRELVSKIALPIPEINIYTQTHDTIPIDSIDLEEEKKRREFFESEENVALLELL